MIGTVAELSEGILASFEFQVASFKFELQFQAEEMNDQTLEFETWNLKLEIIQPERIRRAGARAQYAQRQSLAEIEAATGKRVLQRF